MAPVLIALNRWLRQAAGSLRLQELACRVAGAALVVALLLGSAPLAQAAEPAAPLAATAADGAASALSPAAAASQAPAAAAADPADLAAGARLFEAHCVGCHSGGGNIIRRGRTLKLAALQRAELASPEAIARVAEGGLGQMSGYGAVLGDEGSRQVATWVWNQAQAGWPKR